MLTYPTLDQLRALRLEGMARALEEQHAHPAIEALTFDERLAQLIDRELLLRDSKRIERLLKAARIKVGGACLEDVDYRAGRGLERSQFAALGADFIAMPGHKGLLGPQGTGVLLCKNTGKPLLCGGTGSNSALPGMPDFLPDRLEAGTHNVAGIAGLYAGVRYLTALPAGAVLAHEQALLADFAQRAALLPELTLFYDGGRGAQSGVLSLCSAHMDADRLAEKLGDADVCVREGLHCAPTAHETVGTLEQGTVRLSFSPFNTAGETRRAAAILKKVLSEP